MKQKKCCEIVVKDIEKIGKVGEDVVKDSTRKNWIANNSVEQLSLNLVLESWKKIENRCDWCLVVEKGFKEFFEGKVKAEKEAKELLIKRMKNKS